MGMLTLSQGGHAVTVDTAIVSNKRGIPYKRQIPEVQMWSHAVHLRPWTGLQRGVAYPPHSRIQNLHLKANSSQAKALNPRRPLLFSEAEVTCVLAKLPMMI